MFNFLNPYLLWIKIATAVLAAVAAFSGGMWLEAQIKNTAIANLKAQQLEKAATDATTALAQVNRDVAAIHAAAAAYAGQKVDYDKQFATISKGLKDAIQARPLVAGCVPDSGRVHALIAAVAAANNSGAGHKPVPAVPATP